MDAINCKKGCQTYSSADGKSPVYQCGSCGFYFSMIFVPESCRGQLRHRNGIPIPNFCANCASRMENPQEVAMCQHLRDHMGNGMLGPPTK